MAKIRIDNLLDNLFGIDTAQLTSEEAWLKLADLIESNPKFDEIIKFLAENKKDRKNIEKV